MAPSAPGKAQKRPSTPSKELPTAVTSEEEDDPFSLDFTKMVASPPPPPVEVAPEPVAAAPAAPAPAPVAPSIAAPSMFASLELVPVDAPPAIVEAAPAPAFELTPPATVAVTPAAAPIVETVVTPVAAAPAPAPKPPPEEPNPLHRIALLHAGGQTAEAATELEAALRTGKLGKYTEQSWNTMFDLMQILNRRKAFDNLADAYAKRFERSAPAWLEAEDDGDNSLETGGAAYVALSGTLSAASEGALQKLMGIAQTNPTVRLGLNKVTDADNDGCRLLLDTLRHFKRSGGECLMSGAEEFAAMLSGKVAMMEREREETWLLLLELYLQAGDQNKFEDKAVEYAVTFEVSPPSWETPKPTKATAAKSASDAKKAAVKADDPFVLKGELLSGMNSISALVTAAQGKDAVTLQTEQLARIDETSAKALLEGLAPLQAKGLHIQVRGANLLVAALFQMIGLDKIATIEVRRR